jgi:hypothetical protein
MKLKGNKTTCISAERMVKILETIKLEIPTERILNVKSPIYGEYQDYISENTFTFRKGQIYGLVSEFGGGGDAVSWLLSNEKISVDNVETKSDLCWCLCKPLYSKGLIKTEQSPRNALEEAIKKYGTYKDLNEVIDKFHLNPDRLDYKFSKYQDWEKWRISLAIGCAERKKVFCFSWMDSMYFYDCMYNSSVFRFFKLLKENGAIVILPTSRKENLYGLADEIIYIHNPRFERVFTESSYYKKINKE